MLLKVAPATVPLLAPAMFHVVVSAPRREHRERIGPTAAVHCEGGVREAGVDAVAVNADGVVVGAAAHGDGLANQLAGEKHRAADAGIRVLVIPGDD